jgi:hypothetical protein
MEQQTLIHNETYHAIYGVDHQDHWPASATFFLLCGLLPRPCFEESLPIERRGTGNFPEQNDAILHGGPAMLYLIYFATSSPRTYLPLSIDSDLSLHLRDR